MVSTRLGVQGSLYGVYYTGRREGLVRFLLYCETRIACVTSPILFWESRGTRMVSTILGDQGGLYGADYTGRPKELYWETRRARMVSTVLQDQEA